MLTECFSVKIEKLLGGRHVTGFFVRKQGVKVRPGLQEAGSVLEAKTCAAGKTLAARYFGIVVFKKNNVVSSFYSFQS